jgi:hypothetical protein
MRRWLFSAKGAKRMATSEEKQVEQENRIEQSKSSSESAAAQPKGSGNPDHQGGKVKSAQQPDAEGTIAPTEEEKGGSSE